MHMNARAFCLFRTDAFGPGGRQTHSFIAGSGEEKKTRFTRLKTVPHLSL